MQSAKADNIMIDEYRRRQKKIKAGLMIMNKDAAVHTCNACNKTFRKKFIEDFTINQIMVLLL